MIDPDTLVSVWLCIDCTMAHANGIWPEASRQPRPLSEIDPGIYTIAAGSVHDTEQLGEDMLWEECIHDNRDFDPRPCDGCGDPLAGSRFAATLFPRTV